MYTLVAGGDILLRQPLRLDGEEGSRPPWAFLHNADIAFANLEVPFTTRRERADKLSTIQAAPQLAYELRKMGIDVVTVANNHAADCGVDGIRDTICAVTATGMQAVGGGSNIDEALSPALVGTTTGLRVSFFGIACTVPNGCGAADDRPGIAPVRVVSRFVVDTNTLEECPGSAPKVETVCMPGDTEAVASAIAEHRSYTDIVVVGIHWGVPFGWVAASQGELADYQQPLAHALVDAGADVVIGHHPHVVHGIEVYKGRPIFYSVGNLVFHRKHGSGKSRRPYPAYDWANTVHAPLTRLGALARLEWARPGPPSVIELVPVSLDESGEPQLAAENEIETIYQRVLSLSEAYGTSVTRTRDRVVMGASAESGQPNGDLEIT